MIKEELIPQIKSNIHLLRKLEDLHKRRPYTINTWLKINHPQLCTIPSLELISEELHMDIREIIVPQQYNSN